MVPLNLVRLLPIHDLDETLQAGRTLLELLHPSVEQRVGEALLVSLCEIAVIDHDAIEIAPLGHVLWQVVLLTDLTLPLLDLEFNGFDEV